MDLSGIISIAGKPGLYSVVAQSPSNIIVENLETGRRMPAFASNKISALEDITMYTTNEDMPLPDIVENIWKKEDGKAALSHKDDIKVLRTYLDDVIPECDHEKIYDSDIKKLFQWYNLMVSSGILAKKIAEAAEKEKEEKKESSEKEETAAKAKDDKKTEAKVESEKKAAPKSKAKSGEKKTAVKTQAKAKSAGSKTSSKAK